MLKIYSEIIHENILSTPYGFQVAPLSQLSFVPGLGTIFWSVFVTGVRKGGAGNSRRVRATSH